MRTVRATLILFAVASVPACTCSPVTNDLKFACTTGDECAEGFACRGGECRTAIGDAGACSAAETRSCPVTGCNQVCGADGGFQQCAPITGGPFASNPNHCGECGRTCSQAPGLGCVNSRCTCNLDTDCPSGDVCGPGGICVNSADLCATIRCPVGEVCRAGACGPVTCASGCGPVEICDPGSSLCRPVAACRFPASCDGGLCDGDPKPDGEVCNDGEVCTHTDLCSAGACVGTTYSCSTANQCRTAGACLGDGGCSGTPMGEGTPCNDGANCTFGDQCTSGVCTGTSYTCIANQCASTSGCAGDGGCDVTPRNAGSPCDDTNPCSLDDFCSDAGFCNGTIYTCPAPTPCQASVACAGDGGCLFSDKPEDAGCDDGKMCTTDDRCTNNICNGVVGITYRDNDGDGRGDSNISSMVCPEPAGFVAIGGDCNDNDPDVFQFLMVAADPDQDGATDSTTLTGTCVGATSIIGGRTYYKDLDGTFIWLAAASAAVDCAPTDSDVFQTLNVAQDVDQDGVTLTSTTSSQCVGITSLIGGRTYHADSAGAFTWLTTASATADCLDSDPDVFQTVAVIEDTDQDGYGASTSTVSPRCVGDTSLISARTYHRSVTGTFTWLLGTQNIGSDCNDTNATVQGPATYYPDLDGDTFGAGTGAVVCAQPAMTSLNSTDCNDSSAFVNATRSVFDDTDQDGYTEGAIGSQCTGAASTVSGRTYYRASSGAYTWIETSLGPDCDDTTASVTVPTNWYTDADLDSYGTGLPTSACTAPAGKTASNGNDCNDGSANVFTNRFVYPDPDQDGYTDGVQTTQCTGAPLGVNGRTYYRNLSGTFTWITGSLGIDCSLNNGLLFQNVFNVVADNDRDGYPVGDFQVDVCAGAQSTAGGRIYYASATAGNFWLVKNDCINYQGGRCQPPFDCYDSNSFARPGQLAYFTTSRGDGLFDYDCSGTTTPSVALANYCVAAGSVAFFTDSACLSGAGTATRCSSTPAPTYPAACGQFSSISGMFYNNGVSCVASARQGTTQIGCR